MKKTNESTPSTHSAGSFNSDAFKLGGNQIILCAAAVVIAVLINLIAGQLPATYTQFDLSSEGFFTLSEQSRQIVSSLEEEVTIYLIAETGAENATITNLLDRYKAAGSNIKIEYVDPVLYPAFAMQYTSQTLSANSIIVESSKRFRTVDYSSIFVEDYTNYYTTGQTTSSFDGEGAITSAISYVVSDDLPVVYTLEGHGETALSANIQGLIAKDNYTLSSLNLLTQEAIPEDCDALIIVSPQADLSQRELEVILEYMEKGGSVLLFSDLLQTETPNLDALLAAYGLQLNRGIIIERSGANFLTGGYYHYLLPNISTHDITASMQQAGQYALLPIAQGISETASHRSTLNIQSILTTSASSYLKPSAYDMTTMEKENGDIDGPYSVGAVVTEETGGGTTRLAVFSTSAMLEDTVDQIVYSGNSNLVLSTIGWMCQYEQSMSIHAKAVDSEILVVPASSSNTWSMILIVALPLAVLACGAVVILLRRKK